MSSNNNDDACFELISKIENALKNATSPFSEAETVDIVKILNHAVKTLSDLEWKRFLARFLEIVSEKIFKENKINI